jgi:putative peptide zinc metalloprotease protein
MIGVDAVNDMSEPEVQLDPWQSVCTWRPCLRPHVQIYCHHYRGQPWYVLDDGLSGSYFRFTPAVYHFLQRLDGRQSIDEIYQQLGFELADEAAEKSAILQLLFQLDEAELLQGDVPVSGESLERRRSSKHQWQWQQRFLRPMAQRFSLHNPDRWLKKLQPLVAPLFTRSAFVIWLLLVLTGLLQLAQHWSELTLHYQHRFTDPLNLLLVALCYPLVKAAHELGHATATRHWGGSVNDVGFMLLVLVPLPYVDASSSHAFADKHRRVIVAAAGIMVELAIAALGFYGWLLLPDGIGRDLCFNLILIGGLSTLVFNGNPLLRFDGYYILAEWLEMPNLGQRSSQYLSYLLKRFGLGITAAQSPQTAQGEAGWLLCYGVLAGLYRLFISAVIALWVAGKFFVLGVLLAVWLLLGQLLWPLLKGITNLHDYATNYQRDLRFYSLMGGTLFVFWLLVFVMPVTQSTVVEGIVNLSPNAQLRSDSEGFVEQVLVENGLPVDIGQPLLQLSNAELQAEQAYLEARDLELSARQHAVLLSDRTELDILRADQRAVQSELADIRHQLQSLLVLSPAAGQLAVEQLSKLQGRLIKKGDVLGYVVDSATVEARVAIPQSRADLVRFNSQYIEVRLYNEPSKILSAQLLREVPSATRQLPSALLGSRSGGGIAVDAQDERGLTAMDSVFQFDLALPALTDSYLARRIKVRFVHDHATLAQQLWRYCRQLYIGRQSTVSD